MQELLSQLLKEKPKQMNIQNFISLTLRFPTFGQLSNLVYNKLKLWSNVQFQNFSVLLETET